MLRLLKNIVAITGLVLVCIFCLAIIPTAAGDNRMAPAISMTDLSVVLEEAKSKEKGLQLPGNDEETYGCREAAVRSMTEVNAPEFQKRLHDERQRLQETLFKDALATSAQQKGRNPSAAPQPSLRLYLFVSSSVPQTTLRNYAAMLDRVGSGRISMMLRGFVGGMKELRPTMEFIGGILKKDPACDLLPEKCASYQVEIQVDPQLFQRFKIESVPALAYLPGMANDGEEAHAEPLIISGDAGLDYLLERINREVKSPELEQLIADLRGRTGHGK